MTHRRPIRLTNMPVRAAASRRLAAMLGAIGACLLTGALLLGCSCNHALCGPQGVTVRIHGEGTPLALPPANYAFMVQMAGLTATCDFNWALGSTSSCLGPDGMPVYDLRIPNFRAELTEEGLFIRGETRKEPALLVVTVYRDGVQVARGGGWLRYQDNHLPEACNPSCRHADVRIAVAPAA